MNYVCTEIDLTCANVAECNKLKALVSKNDFGKIFDKIWREKNRLRMRLDMGEKKMDSILAANEDDSGKVTIDLDKMIHSKLLEYLASDDIHEIELTNLNVWTMVSLDF